MAKEKGVKKMPRSRELSFTRLNTVSQLDPKPEPSPEDTWENEGGSTRRYSRQTLRSLRM